MGNNGRLVLVMLIPAVMLTAGCKGKDNLTGPSDPDPGGGGEKAPAMYMDAVLEDDGHGLVVRLFNSIVATEQGLVSKGWIQGGRDIEIPQEQWDQITWFPPNPENMAVGNFTIKNQNVWFNLGRNDFDWAATNSNGIHRNGNTLVLPSGSYTRVRLKILIP